MTYIVVGILCAVVCSGTAIIDYGHYKTHDKSDWKLDLSVVLFGFASVLSFINAAL